MGNSLKSRLSRIISVALGLVVILMGGLAAPPANASPGHADCNVDGNGTQANPWQIWSDVELACFNYGVAQWVPASGYTAYVVLKADVVKTSALPILDSINGNVNNFNVLNFDGQGHTITISNVTNFDGLFVSIYSSPDVSVIQNLTVSSNASTLIAGGGWLFDVVGNTQFTNVHSDGPISAKAQFSSGSGGLIGIASSVTISDCSTSGSIGAGSGGLVGSSTNTLISDSSSSGSIGAYGGGLVGQMFSGDVSYSHSTGSIGANGGGIVGDNASSVSIEFSYSTGSIGQSAGGIAGSDADNLLIQQVYSTGEIGINAGGIVGPYSYHVGVYDAYSLGNIADNGAGIIGHHANTATIEDVYSVGTTGANAAAIIGASSSGDVSHSYALASALYGANSNITTQPNVLSENGGTFNQAHAFSVLAPRSNWAFCASVNPVGFYLTAFYTSDPCAAPAPPTPVPPTPVVPAALAQTGSAGLVVPLSGGLALVVLGMSLVFARRRHISA